jgi:hypothetical protein
MGLGRNTKVAPKAISQTQQRRHSSEKPRPNHPFRRRLYPSCSSCVSSLARTARFCARTPITSIRSRRCSPPGNTVTNPRIDAHIRQHSIPCRSVDLVSRDARLRKILTSVKVLGPSAINICFVQNSCLSLALVIVCSATHSIWSETSIEISIQ